ncbi:MAG: hypothetical protein ACTHPS_13065 [Streptosporangiaceae bacterium]
MRYTTRATVSCAECGDRQTFLGTQWEVTVAAEVWQKTHGRAAHDGGTAAVAVDREATGRDRPDRAAGSDAAGNPGTASGVP